MVNDAKNDDAKNVQKSESSTPDNPVLQPKLAGTDPRTGKGGITFAGKVILAASVKPEKPRED